MPILTFDISIQSTKEKVWDVLWSDKGYRKWTSVFTNGSYAVSDWQEGSPIDFLGPDNSGMFGKIVKNETYTQMVFQHLGEIKNGIKEAMDWENATEDYQLFEKEYGILLLVTMNVPDQFVDFFNNLFHKALQLVKELSEA